MVLPAIIGGATAFGLGSLLGKGGGFEFFTKKEQKVNAPTLNLSIPTQIVAPQQSFSIIGSPNSRISGRLNSTATQPTSQTATPSIILGQGGGSGATPSSSPLGDATNLLLVGGIITGVYFVFFKKRK